MALKSLLVDFNSYFASCEQQVRPELRGKPVGVVPMLADTTSLIAASYEAKQFGVKTLTKVGDAKRLIPHIELVIARHELYIDFHHKAVKAVDEIAPVREVLSIDEMVCDLPAGYRDRERIVELARAIKQNLAAKVGEYLKVSIGIAPNTFLAKLASDMQKPDGLVILDVEDVPAKILHLPLRALSGIGENMELRLKRHRIHNMEQLYALTPEQMRTIWGGVGGERFHARLRGAEVHDIDHGASSISHSHVLGPELRNRDDAYAVINRLTQKAAMRLRKAGFFAGHMAIKVKFLNGPAFENESRFLETEDTLDLLHALDGLWTKYPKKKGLVPLQVAVVLGGFSDASHQSARLFDDLERTEQKHRLNATIDQLNTRFGKHAAYFGGAHRALDHGKLAIAFNHIPDVETEK
ncbi:MAG TPA: DNA polymerase [Usitatibacteraceae bacterium]|nr:DNA polymerase [Usitatibacteraceae bacterium]